MAAASRRYDNLDPHCGGRFGCGRLCRSELAAKGITSHCRGSRRLDKRGAACDARAVAS